MKLEIGKDADFRTSENSVAGGSHSGKDPFVALLQSDKRFVR
jgi:hypothetical protein